MFNSCVDLCACVYDCRVTLLCFDCLLSSKWMKPTSQVKLSDILFATSALLLPLLINHEAAPPHSEPLCVLLSVTLT